LVSFNKKRIFEHYREIKRRKNITIDIIFIAKKNSDGLFRDAPQMLILVLHKDTRSIAMIFLQILITTEFKTAAAGTLKRQ